MIKRYSTPETDALFSEVGKMSRWLEIELAVTDALASVGVVSAETAAQCRANAPIIDEAFVALVETREAITNHDVAAFVDVLQESIGVPAGSWIHYGLTSTDVVDTGLCWALREAANITLASIDELVVELPEDALVELLVSEIHQVDGVDAVEAEVLDPPAELRPGLSGSGRVVVGERGLATGWLADLGAATRRLWWRLWG